MAQQPQQVQVQNPPVSGPDHVPETLCDGQFNLSGNPHFPTLTFTHHRPDATQMFADPNYRHDRYCPPTYRFDFAEFGGFEGLFGRKC